MDTWIALFRGINVGGRNIVPMQAVRDLMTAQGFQNVKTYIQSGNCVFDAENASAEVLSGQLSKLIEDRFGFTPKVMCLSGTDLDEAIAANPYEQGYENPKSVHFFFLAEAANNAKMDALHEVKKENEEINLTDKVCYLYAPDGIGRSKLAERLERCLGVAMTGRNFRSVLKIAELAGFSD